MELVVLSSVIAVFLLVSALLSGVGERIDRKNERLRSVRMAQSETKRPAKSLSLKERLEKIKASRQRKAAREKTGNVKKKKMSEAEQLLDAAGSTMTGMQFTLVKLGAGIGLGLVVYILGPMLNLAGTMRILAPAGAFIVGELMPIRILRSKVAKKKSVYRDALPDIMDLLVVSVEAGLGFDAALLRLYEKDKSPMMEELIRGSRDIQHGMSKKESYANVSRRCGVKEVTSFLNALVQAEQMGISIKTVLKSQADSLREERRQRAEEKALKAPITMMIPLVMFVFPVIFVILLGPAAMNLMEVLG